MAMAIVFSSRLGHSEGVEDDGMEGQGTDHRPDVPNVRKGRVVHAYHADPVGVGDQTRPCW